MQTLTGNKRRLQGYEVVNKVLSNLDLRNAFAYQSSWTNVIFTDVQFNCSDFRNAKFLNCTFERCDLSQANFSVSRVEGCTFESCTADLSQWLGVMAKQVIFRGCRLHYASFHEGMMEDVVFDDSNLHGADLCWLKADGVNFAGTVLWGAKVTLGCQFFDQRFSERELALFLSMVARKYQDPERRAALEAIAGPTAVKVVDRLMREVSE